MQKDNNRENNPQEDENENVLIRQFKNLIDLLELLKQNYAKSKKDLDIALEENERLKKELRTRPVAKFQFNVN